MKKIFLTFVISFLAFGSLFVPASLVHAQQIDIETTTAIPENAVDVLFRDTLKCGFIDPLSSIMGCVAQSAYYFLYIPTNFIATLSAHLLDFSIGYTTDSDSYGGTGQTGEDSFVTKGWTIVRDISNIFFILMLLIVAISQILGLAGMGAQKMLAKIIIIALLINFSLFFSKVIVDGSNILALIFYDSIAIQNNQNTTGYKDLSVGIVDKFNPQSLLSEDMFVQSIPGVAQDDVPVQEPSERAGWIFFIVVLASIVNILMIGIFATVSVLMIARVVGIWMMMIFSPLAFATYTVPGGENWAQIGFKNWIKELVKLSFLAPIFLFFLYLIIMFINTPFIESAFSGSGTSTMQKIMAILIPFALIIVLLRTAKDLAKSMSGKVGAAALKLVKTTAMVAGAAVGGAALGAGAIAGRATLGKAASAASKSGRLNKLANSSTRLGRSAGRQLQGIAERGSKASFDGRNSRVSAFIDKKAGTKLSQNTFGGETKGGFAGQQERITAKRKNQAEKLTLSGDKAQTQDARSKKYEFDEKKFMEEVTSHSSYSSESVDQKTKIRESAQKSFKENYENKGTLSSFTGTDTLGNAQVVGKTGRDNVVKTGSVGDSDSINLARKAKFAEDLRRGTGLGYLAGQVPKAGLGIGAAAQAAVKLQNPIKAGIQATKDAQRPGRPDRFNEKDNRIEDKGTSRFASAGNIQAAQAFEKIQVDSEKAGKAMNQLEKQLSNLSESMKTHETKLSDPAGLNLNPKDPDLATSIATKKTSEQAILRNILAQIKAFNLRTKDNTDLSTTEQTEYSNLLEKQHKQETNIKVLENWVTVDNSNHTQETQIQEKIQKQKKNMGYAPSETGGKSGSGNK